MATIACLNPAHTLLSLHIGMYLFIIGSTWECPSDYVGVVSASISEVTLSVWRSPTGEWPEAQALPHQEKLFFLGPRPSVVFKHDDSDPGGRVC